MKGDPLAYLLRRPWRDVQLPASAVGIPTMLSKTERKLLYGLARDYPWAGAAIVDAGCFLGGSTAALLSGARDRPVELGTHSVVSYDLFRVEAYTVRKFFAGDPGIRVGDSFRHRFDENVSGFNGSHVVQEGDITEIGWSGEPIDVLFLDVLKSREINDAVLRDFFPALIPGRSVIVHQDYAGGFHPWIAITAELMRDALILVDWMEWGTHVFFVDGDIPAELMESGLRGVDEDRQFELIDRVINRSDGWVRGMMEIARAELVAERDGTAAALAELEAIAQRHREHGLVLSCIEDLRMGLETNWTYEAPARRSWLPRRVRTRLGARSGGV